MVYPSALDYRTSLASINYPTGVLLMVFLLSIPAIVCSLLMAKRNTDPA